VSVAVEIALEKERQELTENGRLIKIVSENKNLLSLSIVKDAPFLEVAGGLDIFFLI
jgi:hypothetical protein